MNEDQQVRPEDEPFLERAGRQLREDAERLDAATQSRLNQARHRALEELTQPKSLGWVPGRSALALAGSLAAVVLAVALLNSPRPVSDGSTPVATEDIDMLLAGERLEMIEDLEFYQWLGEPDGSAVLLADPDNMG